LLINIRENFRYLRYFSKDFSRKAEKIRENTKTKIFVSTLFTSDFKLAIHK
jgi:hypothetical protein